MALNLSSAEGFFFIGKCFIGEKYELPINVALENRDKVAKHNKAKGLLKSVSLSRYWDRTDATVHLFKFAVQIDSVKLRTPPPTAS